MSRSAPQPPGALGQLDRAQPTVPAAGQRPALRTFPATSTGQLCFIE